MQTEILQPADLLDAQGRLTTCGWSRQPLLNYRRDAVKAPKFRLKEWDYYYVHAGEVGLSVTVADNGYLGFVSVTFFDFAVPCEVTKAVMVPFPLGKFGMPASSGSGDVVFRNKSLTLEFRRTEGGRTLTIDCDDFAAGQALHGVVHLSQPPGLESLTIATPFAGAPLSFYYNQKVNCQPAQGELSFGKRKLVFDPATCFGVLDWGRGVWTYQNTWYWGSASGLVLGQPFGFNLGYGFGDTAAASENVVYWKGRANKLDQVTFHLPEDSYLKPWKFTSNDGRLELDFVPVLDRASDTNVLLIRSNQHQVFGRFTGTVVMDDGSSLAVKDLFGFAEKVYNRW
ncbi:MAG: DUF2804 domain-containing protein [Spirochaetales bacterium]